MEGVEDSSAAAPHPSGWGEPGAAGGAGSEAGPPSPPAARLSPEEQKDVQGAFTEAVMADIERGFGASGPATLDRPSAERAVAALVEGMSGPAKARTPAETKAFQEGANVKRLWRYCGWVHGKSFDRGFGAVGTAEGKVLVALPAAGLALGLTGVLGSFPVGNTGDAMKDKPLGEHPMGSKATTMNGADGDLCDTGMIVDLVNQLTGLADHPHPTTFMDVLPLLDQSRPMSCKDPPAALDQATREIPARGGVPAIPKNASVAKLFAAGLLASDWDSPAPHVLNVLGAKPHAVLQEAFKDFGGFLLALPAPSIEALQRERGGANADGSHTLPGGHVVSPAKATSKVTAHYLVVGYKDSTDATGAISRRVGTIQLVRVYPHWSGFTHPDWPTDGVLRLWMRLFHATRLDAALRGTAARSIEEDPFLQIGGIDPSADADTMRRLGAGDEEARRQRCVDGGNGAARLRELACTGALLLKVYPTSKKPKLGKQARAALYRSQESCLRLFFPRCAGLGLFRFTREHYVVWTQLQCTGSPVITSQALACATYFEMDKGRVATVTAQLEVADAMRTGDTSALTANQERLERALSADAMDARDKWTRAFLDAATLRGDPKLLMSMQPQLVKGLGGHAEPKKVFVKVVLGAEGQGPAAKKGGDAAGLLARPKKLLALVADKGTGDVDRRSEEMFFEAVLGAAAQGAAAKGGDVAGLLAHLEDLLALVADKGTGDVEPRFKEMAFKALLGAGAKGGDFAGLLAHLEELLALVADEGTGDVDPRFKEMAFKALLGAGAKGGDVAGLLAHKEELLALVPDKGTEVAFFGALGQAAAKGGDPDCIMRNWSVIAASCGEKAASLLVSAFRCAGRPGLLLSPASALVTDPQQAGAAILACGKGFPREMFSAGSVASVVAVAAKDVSVLSGKRVRQLARLAGLVSDCRSPPQAADYEAAIRAPAMRLTVMRAGGVNVVVGALAVSSRSGRATVQLPTAALRSLGLRAGYQVSPPPVAMMRAGLEPGRTSPAMHGGKVACVTGGLSMTSTYAIESAYLSRGDLGFYATKEGGGVEMQAPSQEQCEEAVRNVFRQQGLTPFKLPPGCPCPWRDADADACHGGGNWVACEGANCKDFCMRDDVGCWFHRGCAGGDVGDPDSHEPWLCAGCKTLVPPHCADGKGVTKRKHSDGGHGKALRARLGTESGAGGTTSNARGDEQEADAGCSGAGAAAGAGASC